MRQFSHLVEITLLCKHKVYYIGPTYTLVAFLLTNNLKAHFTCTYMHIDLKNITGVLNKVDSDLHPGIHSTINKQTGMLNITYENQISQSE